MLQRLLNKGIPEHIVADGIIHIWLYMAGSKKEREAKERLFNQRFRLSDLESHGKELTSYVKENLEKSLVWASENLTEYLPEELKSEYLDHYLTFCTTSKTLWLSEYYIIQYVADLFGIQQDGLFDKFGRKKEFNVPDLNNEQYYRGLNQRDFILSRDQVSNQIKKLRQRFRLPQMQVLHEEKQLIESRPKSTKEPVRKARTMQGNNDNKRKEAVKSGFVNESFNRLKVKVKQNKWVSLSVAVVLIIVIGSIIREQAKEFEHNLNLYAQEMNVEFETRHRIITSNLRSNNREAYRLFEESFDKQNAIDNNFSRFFGVKYEFSYPNSQYLTCLEEDAKARIESARNKQKSDAKYSEFRERFGESFSTFLKQIDDKGINLFYANHSDCYQYFGEREYHAFNENYWNDIEKVLLSNSKERVAAAAKSMLAENRFDRDLQNARSQLRSNYRNSFISQVDRQKSTLLKQVENEIEMMTNNIGSWTITTTHLEYDESALQQILNRALVSQWETNSLRTGSMPYSNCYGASNTCSGRGCSNVEVSAGGSDVIVTFKNRSDLVVRHGYINSGDKFTFNLPNGSYQIYFYSGRGWNPNKVQSGSSCTNLRGGFVSREAFSKDREWNRLNNHILTFQLREMTSGNFRPAGSNASEAF